MQYLLPKARNTVTNEVVKTQDLSGGRYELSQRPMAELAAHQLANKMTARTREPWEGFVEVYTPVTRKK
jgi:hypothetical protein